MQHSRSTGVRIGLHVPDAFGPYPADAFATAVRCATLAVPAIELDASALEACLGAPVAPAFLASPDFTVEAGILPDEAELFQQDLDLARTTFAARLRAWRRSVSLAPLDALRRAYDDAGVQIEIVRWPDLGMLEDDELDYGFRLALAAGARVLSTEWSIDGATRVGPFAERYGVFVGFRTGADATIAEIEAALNVSPFNAVNLDLGDWIVGVSGSPLAFLTAHADRVTHVHLGDRRLSDGAVAWFGQGDAPIREVLQAMRQEAWSFQATVEIAYDLATEADQMAEIARAIAYCQEACARVDPGPR
jgi:sugar phosphate isomerase/epimerase